MRIILVVLAVALIVVCCVWGFTANKKSSNDCKTSSASSAETETKAEPVYFDDKPEATQPAPTEPPEIKNTVKNLSIKNIIGCWKEKGVEATAETAVQYYTFTEGGTAQLNYGTVTSVGEYKDNSSKNKHKVTIDVEQGLQGAFIFDVTGNKKDGYTLTLIDLNTKDTVMVLESAKEPLEKEFALAENPKIDPKLVGYWLDEETGKSYTFNADGSFERKTGGVVTKGTWTVKEEKVLTIRYFREKVKYFDMDYILEGNTVAITKAIYTKQES